MKKLTTSRAMEMIVDATVRKLTELSSASRARDAALEARIAELERRAGIEASASGAKDHQPGDVVVFGDAEWECRGMGRWRRIESENCQ